MLRRREKEIGINIVILGQRPPLRVFQIDVPACDSVQGYSPFAIYMGCNPFLPNPESSKLSPWILQESFSIFTLVLLFPTQSIAFLMV